MKVTTAEVLEKIQDRLWNAGALKMKD